jgi:hypothetical protein
MATSNWDDGNFNTLEVAGAATVGGGLAVTGATTAGALTLSGLYAGSSESGITAFAGGGQSSARALTKQVNSVDTVATAADSVRLPAATAGRVVYVINTTATSMQVFGASTDTINGIATGTGVAQAAGKSATYVCAVAGAWYRVLSA